MGFSFFKTTAKMLYDGMGIASTVITIAGADHVKKIRFEKRKDRYEMVLDGILSTDEVLNAKIDKFKTYFCDTTTPRFYTRKQIEKAKDDFLKKNQSMKMYENELMLLMDQLLTVNNEYVENELSFAEKVIKNQLEESCEEIIAEVAQVKEDMKEEIEEQSKMLQTMLPNLFPHKSNVVLSHNLTNLAPQNTIFYSYREKDIKNAKMILERSGHLSIKGLGGIGKTSVAKDLFYQYDKMDGFIGWVNYAGNLRDDFLTVYSEQKDLKPSERIEAFLSFCKEHRKKVLLFIDNVEESICEDPFFLELRDLICMVVTTRMNDFDEVFEEYPLQALPKDNCLLVFEKYYKCSLTSSQKELVNEMLGEMDYHTLMTELLAKAARKYPGTLEDFVKEYGKKRLACSMIRIKSSHHSKEATLYASVTALFSMQHLSDCEKYIMKNMSLTPNKPVSQVFFKMIYCGMYARSLEESISHLMDLGWIEKKKDGTFYMHPVMKESIQCQEDLTEFDLFFLPKYLEEAFYDQDWKEKLELAHSIIQYFGKKKDYFAALREMSYKISQFLAALKIDYYSEAFVKFTCECDDVLLTAQKKRLEARIMYIQHLFEARQLKRGQEMCEMYELEMEEAFGKESYFFYIYNMLYADLLAAQAKGVDSDFMETAKDIMHSLYIGDYEQIPESTRLRLLINYASVMIDSKDYKNLSDVIKEIESTIKKDEVSEELSMYYFNLAVFYGDMASQVETEDEVAYREYAEKAFTCDKKAYCMRRMMYGKEHLVVAYSYHALGLGLTQLFEDDEKQVLRALSYFCKAQCIFENKCLEDDPYLSRNAHMIQELYRVLSLRGAQDKADEIISRM